jgi:hypothetical protein
LQTTLNEGQAMVFERLLELVKQVTPRVYDTLNPQKIVDLFKLGDGTPPRFGIRIAELVEGFYSFMGFTRLTSEIAIRKAIVRGVKDGVFGYTSGSVPVIGPDGKFQVARLKVAFETEIADDEVDLESGFIVLPAAIPVAVAPTAQPVVSEPPPSGGEPVLVPTTTTSGPTTPGAVTQKSVELTFSADRDQLYSAWQAIANLAELAGKVSVTVKAESEKGFDQSKLRNGVLEPLEEADLIK